jgi:putative ATP-dependent endonuclease of the OLD family
MKLTYFKVENYRSIKTAEFKKLSNVAILVGPNNEGKSNILQALHTSLTLLEEAIYQPRRVSGAATEKVLIRYDRNSYDWESDYPVDKQSTNPEGHSIFDLHFSLTEYSICISH